MSRIFIAGIGAVFLRPPLAFGEAVRRERAIRLDRGVERHAGFDGFGLDGEVGLGIGGEGLERDSNEKHGEADSER